MPRCYDSRPLSELDPVTFFIVTELMAVEAEFASVSAEDSTGDPLIDFGNPKVA